MWFDGWNGIARIVLVGIAAYVALVVLLRTSGKRTLAKLNAFDLIVTVALGSSLATVLLSKDVAALEGVTAFLVLVGCQYVLTWLSVRSRRLRALLKSEPRVLLWRGEPLPQALRAERVTLEELESAVRSQGLSALSEAGAVVLETDGSMNVVRQLGDDTSALRSVEGARD